MTPVFKPSPEGVWRIDETGPVLLSEEAVSGLLDMYDREAKAAKALAASLRGSYHDLYEADLARRGIPTLRPLECRVSRINPKAWGSNPQDAA